MTLLPGHCYLSVQIINWRGVRVLCRLEFCSTLSRMLSYFMKTNVVSVPVATHDERKVGTEVSWPPLHALPTAHYRGMCSLWIVTVWGSPDEDPRPQNFPLSKEAGQLSLHRMSHILDQPEPQELGEGVQESMELVKPIKAQLWADLSQP